MSGEDALKALHGELRGIQSELRRAQRVLRSVDVDERQLDAPAGRAKRPRDDDARSDEEAESPTKRRTLSSAVVVDSGDVLASAVVGPKIPAKRKERSVRDEQRDARRRQLGNILGILQQAKKEVEGSGAQLRRRQEIKMRIERAESVEKTDAVAERRRQLAERREREEAQQAVLKERQEKIWRLVREVHLAKHEAELAGFLKTKSRPEIYYLPAVVDGPVGDGLAERRAEAVGRLEALRAEVEKATPESGVWARVREEAAARREEAADEPRRVRDESSESGDSDSDDDDDRREDEEEDRSGDEREEEEKRTGEEGSAKDDERMNESDERTAEKEDIAADVDDIAEGDRADENDAAEGDAGESVRPD